MEESYKAIAEYSNRAADLAEAVKRCITKDGKIDNKTVLALNKFLIAANAVADLLDPLTEELERENNKLN